MEDAKVIFLSYLLETSPITGGTLPFATGQTFGYSTPIHCGYIERFETDDITNKRINFTFDENLFPFMRSSEQIISGGNGYGWTAFAIKVLLQIVDITGSTSATTHYSPSADSWKIIDVTDQIEGHVSGTAINPTGLTSTLFEIDPDRYPLFDDYDISYLNYPSSLPADDNKLAFGEEVFFYGNVKTDIAAEVFTSDIAILLPLNEYNYSENPTWDANGPVYISEIGIFDDDNNLVGIGKLNYPISKDSSQYRSFSFNIDF